MDGVFQHKDFVQCLYRVKSLLSPETLDISIFTLRICFLLLLLFPTETEQIKLTYTVLIYAYSEFKISCIELDIKGIHLIRIANYKRD